MLGSVMVCFECVLGSVMVCCEGVLGSVMVCCECAGVCDGVL